MRSPIFARIKRAPRITSVERGLPAANCSVQLPAGLQRSKYAVNTMTRSKCEMSRVATTVRKHAFVDKLPARRVIDLNSGYNLPSSAHLSASPSLGRPLGLPVFRKSSHDKNAAFCSRLADNASHIARRDKSAPALFTLMCESWCYVMRSSVSSRSRRDMKTRNGSGTPSIVIMITG